MRYVIWGTLALAMTCVAFGGSKEDEIELGGVHFGMTSQELVEIAKRRHKKLEGPGKERMDHDVNIFVQVYTIARDQQINRVSGAKRQAIMLLNHKVIAVELWFRGKRSLKDYLNELEDLGYEKKGEDYVGTVQTGDYAGKKVYVKVGTMTGARRRKMYKIQARCFEVLGDGVTAEKVMEAQGNAAPARTTNEAMGRTL